MQDNLAHLEQEAQAHSVSTPSHTMAAYPARSASFQQQQQYQQQQSAPMQSSYATQGGPYGTYFEDRSSYIEPSYSLDEPSFSPFPVLENPPPHGPPTDEQREANLENGRVAVLNSNDPEMQVAWAQDALSYVEVSLQNEMRNAIVAPPRPSTPAMEHQLRSDSINVVSFLADQHHPRAEFIRGMWLEFGKFGFRMDKVEAFRCYARAAERGYARAEYRMGMQFENSNEPQKAIAHYQKGVQQGDSASHYRLGMMILLGQHGQKQDYIKGLEHIRYAAETCDENAPQGAYVFGMLLARELPQVAIPDELLAFDIDAARMNIEKAAYHGFAKAQVKMGAAYELCQLGCDFDPQMSLHYNILAARQGEPEAEMAISKWFLCGHEGLFEKNDEIAFKYAKRAASSGLPTAEFALGYFYEIGIYVPVDIKEARTWYAKAAASGNKDATGRIDSISRSKTLSRKDHETVAIAKIKSRYGTQRGRPGVNDGPESVYGPSGATAPYPENDFGPGYPDAAGPPGGNLAFGFNPNPQPQQPAPLMTSRQQSHGPASPPVSIGYSAPPDRRPMPGPGGPPQSTSTWEYWSLSV
ncbi:hypothetical protein KEM56_003978 [Ascosphaera pollenicola]|nr:hypothetical protein KEM56_003978 [Ascosphaera pollenicola]